MPVVGSTSLALDWGTFFVFGVPLAVAMLLMMWVCLACLRFPVGVIIDTAVVRVKLRRLGPVGRAEATTLGLLLALVTLWLLRDPGWLPDGVGWAHLTAAPAYVSDATAATLVAVLLFVIPHDASDGNGEGNAMRNNVHHRDETHGDDGGVGGRHHSHHSRSHANSDSNSNVILRGPAILDLSLIHI